MMTEVKCGSEAWALQKVDEDLLDVFQRNCLWIVLRTRLTDRISNSRLYEKCSIPLSRAFWEGVKRETLNKLGWRRSARSCVGFRQLGATVSCC